MGFDAKLTITGLCLLITDHAETPGAAELLVLDTAGAQRDHRHHPYMAFPYESRGNLRNQQLPTLPGWEEYVIGPDGRAITRVLLENTILRIRVETESGAEGAFVREHSMDRVPDLRLLGVTSINQPGSQNSSINGATSRVLLPRGTLFTSGEVRDNAGPVEWQGVGVIAEFMHLQLRGLSRLQVDYVENSFDLIPAEGGDGVVQLSISNEPTTLPLSVFNASSNVVAVPHFHMFMRIADHRPELVRAGNVTPSNPACPVAAWIQSDFPFLTGGV